MNKRFRSLVLLFCYLAGLLAFAGQASAQGNYVCPMHPEVTARQPGACPKCGMALRQPGARNTQVATGPVAPPRLPDLPVLDQHGRRLRFYSDLIEGQTVAINFVFTTCTTICPPLAATFRKVQQQLGARRDVRLLSISVDPTTDVPERLEKFAAQFAAAPGWSFLTGAKPDIDALLKALGAGVADKNDHTPLVLIGNARAGYWTRAYGLAPVATLVNAINEAAAQPPVVPPATAAARYFPNHELLTQDNQPVRFFDDLVKGRTVLINFMFTTCSGVCSPMTANLAKLQAALGDRVGRDILMLSLTVDPLVDTPAVLAAYAAKFKLKPGWHFLTGKPENVEAVLAKLGGYVTDKNQHNNLLIVGNVETGEWLKLFAMANPAELAKAVLKVADGKRE